MGQLKKEIEERVQQEPDELLRIWRAAVKKKSQCVSRTTGGDLGTFRPGQMAKEFDDALFPEDPHTAPQPSDIIGPIVTRSGIHIILVTGRPVGKIGHCY